MQGLLHGLVATAGLGRLLLCSCRPIQATAQVLCDPRVRFLIRGGWKGLLWLQMVLPLELRRSGADLFHGSLYLSPLFCPCPSVVNVYDLSFRCLPAYLERKNRLILELLVPRSVRRASKVITLSEFTRKEILEQWCLPPEKVVVIPGAPLPHFYSALSPQDMRAVLERYALEDPYMVYVGTLEPRKNLPALIEAFGIVQRAGFASCRLAIVGRPGWRLDEFYDAVERSSSKRSIKLIGYVPDRDLPALYKGARAVVYLSLYEGFGFPPLEAMASGSAVVASNRASIPECVGEAGLLVDPSNVEEIAEKMLLLLKDEDLRRELAARGVARSLRFSWERSAEAMAAHYRELCGSGVSQ